MKKRYIVIISMLAAALAVAGVFCTVLLLKNSEMKKWQTACEAALKQAESENEELRAAADSLEAMQTESETAKETEEMTEPEEPETKGKKVAIDPGHQSSSVDMSALEPMGPGAKDMKAKASTGTTGKYTGVPEYALNLEISKKLCRELESRGYEVVLTREDNETAISNKERALMAYDEGADIYVRIHANGSEDTSANGAMTMVPSAQNPYVAHLYEESAKLGENIINAYCGATGMENDGVQYYDNMTGINWSKIPVVILEMGYMSNEKDDTNMQDAGYQEKMVTGIANGIDGYFGFQHSEDEITDGDAGSEDESADEGTDAETDEENAAGDIKETVEALTAPRNAQGERWAVYAAKAGGSDGFNVGSRKMPAASLIKLYIMGAVYENYEPLTTIAATDELDRLLGQMITVSDNEAANSLTKLLGGGDAAVGRDIVNEFCASHGYGDTSMGRMLLEANPSGDNYTSVKDCGMFLNDLYIGNLSGSAEMTALLKGQQRRGKIPAGVPAGTVTANKTGELSDVENDAAIVYTDDGAYILCIMSENLVSSAEARDLIVRISEKVYEDYK